MEDTSCIIMMIPLNMNIINLGWMDDNLDTGLGMAIEFGPGCLGLTMTLDQPRALLCLKS